LKELNKISKVENYLVPLLSQTIEESTKFNLKTHSNIKILEIIQKFPMIGKDLTQIDGETYRTNRDTIIQTLSEAVNFLHINGVLHRDIKPDNIVWDGERARLIDFDNIARDGERRNYFGGSFPKNMSIFTKGYDLECVAITIQTLDLCYFSEKIDEFWPDGINEYARTRCTKAGGAASVRSTRTTKRRRPNKNGRSGQRKPSRRNCTRHVAR
jgi:serine/threonine protein kinase